MDACVHELLSYYQREIREDRAATELLARLGITSPEVVDHFALGYCSGRALGAASDETARELKSLGLVFRAREIFTGCIVFPVSDESGGLVDLFGMRFAGNDRRYYFWQDPPRGLIGREALDTYPEVILAGNAYYALHARQLGYPNIVALRYPDETAAHIEALQRPRMIYLLARKHRHRISPKMEEAGLRFHSLSPKRKGEMLSDKTFAPVMKREGRAMSGLRVVAREGARLVVDGGEIRYRVDPCGARLTMGLKAMIRAERNERSYLERVDLGSGGARQRFAKTCGMGLVAGTNMIERDMEEIADLLDRLREEMAREGEPGAKVLSGREESRARMLLAEGDVLGAMAGCLERELGIVGEEANRKLAVLIAASRLLPSPLGCIVRGDPSSGKSTLIRAIGRLMPEERTLVLSRLTAQSLYFLPRERLVDSVIVVDEYEGLAASEYALRSLMSNQELALAITVREGGEMPTTRTIRIPTRLAIFVSTTKEVNVENLSRFIELRMDASREQTRKVLRRLAIPDDIGSNTSLELMRDANRLLLPCRVEIPFGERLLPRNGSVLARRHFGHAVELIRAHAALNQLQRKHDKSEAALVVRAEYEDFRVVQELLKHTVDSPEESMTPGASELLQNMHKCDLQACTIKQAMHMSGWSYSKTYRALEELSRVSLVVADHHTNGVERVYQVSPYERIDGGIPMLPIFEGV